MGKEKKEEKELKPFVDKNGNVFKTQAFMIEDQHPAVGRILIVDDRKYKVMDDIPGGLGTGTFIKPMTEEDEEMMREYDRDLEELSEKLVEKVDLKRMIKEQIKKRPLQDIKTGLFILKQEENGEKIEVEHSSGCYHFRLIHRGKSFDFMSGFDVENNTVFR